MKRFLIQRLLAGIVLIACTLTQAAANGTIRQWEPIGPTGATVFSQAQDPFSTSTLWVGNYFGGLHRSTDFGLSWTHIPTQFSQLTVMQVAPSPHEPGRMAVATFQGGAFMTADGTAWESINTGLPSLTLQDIAFDPFSASRMLAATVGGVARSGNTGQSWIVTNTINSGKTVLYDRWAQNRVFLGTLDRGVFISNDGGTTWTARNAGLSSQIINHLDWEANGNNLYASTAGGVFRLARNGTVWQDITFNLPQTPVQMVYDQPALGRLYAVTNDGIYHAAKSNVSAGWTRISEFPARYVIADEDNHTLLAASLFNRMLRTTDDGQNWIDSDQGMQNYFVGAMGGTLDAQNRRVIVAGTDNGIFRATETAPATGQLQPWLHTGLFEPTFGLAGNVAFPHLMFAGTERAGVWRSEDFGLNWQRSSDGIVPVEIFDIAQSPTASPTLYIGTSAGLFTSRDDGGSWELGVKDLIVNRVFAVAVDPVQPGVAYFSSENGQVYRTNNDGASFQSASGVGLPNEDILDLALVPFGRAYARTGSGELYASDNLGGSWTLLSGSINQPVLAVDYNPAFPWIVYAATQGGGLYFSDTNGAFWAPLTNGITNPFIFDVTISPNDPGVIYAASVGRVFVTIDGGVSWAERTQGLPADGIITQVTLEPGLPQMVYASVRNGGIYRSNDGGTTYQPVGPSLPVGGTIPVAVSTVTPGKLFAGTRAKGVHTTLDRGDNWIATNYGVTVFTRAIDYSAVQPSQMFAASLGSGVFRTTNGGQTWENRGLFDRFLFDVEVNPQIPDTVFAGSSRGISRSVDAGETWQTLGQGLDFILSMSVDPDDPETIYVGGSGETSRVLVSHDAGHSWTERNGGLPAASVLALLADGPTGALFCAPQGLGVYRSDDGGENWTPTNNAAFGSNDVTVLVSVPQINAIFAGTSGRGFIVTLDGGVNWFASNTGLPPDASISSIVVDPTNVNRIYLGLFGARVYRTDDGGATWLPVSAGLPQVVVNKLRIDPFNPLRIWAATSSGIYLTTDRGVTWGQARLTGKTVLDVIADPQQQGVLLAGVQGDGVYRSTNGGADWQKIAGTVAALTPRHLAYGAPPADVYLGSSGAGFLRSRDGGLTWPQPETLFHPFVTTLEIDPQNADTVYAGAADIGVIKTTDNGETWRVMSDGLTSNYSLSMAIDPLYPQTVYLGTIDAGVFMTEDGGMHWEHLDDGLYNKVVTSLLIDPADRNVIYAGTEGGGAFRMTVRGTAAREWSLYD
jgi:photosystem II stability/assembly factor-like uncharacterized protein